MGLASPKRSRGSCSRISSWAAGRRTPTGAGSGSPSAKRLLSVSGAPFHLRAKETRAAGSLPLFPLPSPPKKKPRLKILRAEQIRVAEVSLATQESMRDLRGAERSLKDIRQIG